MKACLSPAQLRDLIRPMANRLSGGESELSLREVVMEILTCAQSFVPSAAGSILLSHPKEDGALVFVAATGVGSDKLPGRVLPAGTGIAGRVFTTGEPVLTNSPDQDIQHYKEIDNLTQLETKSLLCVPLQAHGEAVGVLSLLNSLSGEFETKDLELLQIFSRYLTQSIQTILEAKRQREASIRDHLSGLYNDRYLYRFLASAISHSLESELDLGLIFLDLDHFKAVVDTHGHLVGSQALRESGYLIGEVADKYRGVAARYGGDEYVVVVLDTDPKTMARLAEDLRVKMEHAVLECEGEGRTTITLDRQVTASVGVVCLSQLDYADKTPEQIRQRLIRVADEAMYQAKALGKNRVHWHQSEVSRA